MIDMLADRPHPEEAADQNDPDAFGPRGTVCMALRTQPLLRAMWDRRIQEGRTRLPRGFSSRVQLRRAASYATLKGTHLGVPASERNGDGSVR